jgi:hypothetical protein
MNEPSPVAGKGVVSTLAQQTNVWPARSRVHHAWHMNASTDVYGIEFWATLR